MYMDAKDGTKRYHLTDGFIFTPNLPYQVRGCQELFKWKYPDLVCVRHQEGEGKGEGEGEGQHTRARFVSIHDNYDRPFLISLMFA